MVLELQVVFLQQKAIVNMGRIWPALLVAALLATASTAVQVVEFGIDRIEGNVFEIQPNEVNQPIVDFSICLRFKFWTWDTKVLFGTNFMFFIMFPPSTRLNDAYLVLNDSYGIPFDIRDMKVSPTLWNSFCWAYNSTNASLTMAVNNYRTSQGVNKTIMESGSLGSRIMVGDDPKDEPRGFRRFSGLVTDVNVWNRTLNENEIKSFTLQCSDGLYSR